MMSVKAEKRLLSGDAWDDYCENLRLTGKMIEQFGDDVTDQDRTEWYRFLTRYVRMGFEHYVECSEPTRPRFHEMTWRQTINFTSPLQDHFFADFVDGSADYIIDGNKGTIPHFVIASLEFDGPDDFDERNWAKLGTEGLKEFNTALLKTKGAIQSQDMHFDEAGNFKVVVSQNKPEGEGNWLSMTAGTSMLLARCVYKTRDGTTPATMTIRRADANNPKPIDASFLSGALAKSGQMTLAYAELARSWWQENLSHRPNTVQFSESLYMSNGGVKDDRFHGFGAWECAPDEALIVKFKPIPCEFWTFQYCNIWQENFDNYEEGQGYVHKYGVSLDDDGFVTMIVAHTDPKIGGNWIDPYGHTHGGWSFRLIKTNNQPPPPVHSCTVKIADLHNKGLSIVNEIKPLISGGVVD